MTVSLKDKLQQHEVVPPPFVWAKISMLLDEEFVPDDIDLSSRLENASVAAPLTVWNNISASLNEENKQKPARLIPLFYKRIAIAVVLAGVMAVSAMYLFTGNKNKALFNRSSKSETAEKQIENKVPAPVISTEPAPQTKEVPEEKLLIASSQVRRPAGISRKSAYQPEISETEASSDIIQSNPSTLQTVPALQPINVSAPPIRDSRGNIIMDIGLISKPDEPYIVVTGPNGHQTKISNKFLNCLRYINGNFSSSDMDQEGNDCKTRFEEWRKKILSEAAFIPAANNFFDIFELKDMIQDR